jgi:hypothetical protein
VLLGAGAGAGAGAAGVMRNRRAHRPVAR